MKFIEREIEILRGQIDKVIEALADPNLVDSLKGAFMMTASVMKQIENARKTLEIVFDGIPRC
jgi:hypoxanthine-guanine phosphoribosyltransferase